VFGSILIANRGEIALRVARTCRELGIRVIAVCSTADRGSAVTRLADETVQIGPPAARRSYLNMPAILEAALRTNAEAIHPGYGFLSEDADFSDACDRYGIAFVGPPAGVLERIGDKAATRALMAAAGLPILPGSEGAVGSAGDAGEVADEIGYPVMLKAAAGGGGRGMAVVRHPGNLFSAFTHTRAHAQAVFGDDRIYVERFVERPRHVEVQVLRDRYGAVIQLGERDCSAQRHHQKLVEETPAPGLSPELTARLWQSAIRGAHAAGLVGAATVEFLVDEDASFTFMEINGRIQVEHPVTEMVTGLDIVREQLSLAEGRPLRLKQADVQLFGAALECRVNTEDPDRTFAPTPGTLEEFVVPGGPFVRVDTHGFPGWTVTPYYDPLLAKVVVWGRSRDEIVCRMDRALEEFRVHGPHVCTNIPFLRTVLAHPRFRTAQHTTGLVEEMLASHGSTGDHGCRVTGPGGAPSEPLPSATSPQCRADTVLARRTGGWSATGR
jgi:acetyl-CoA carboxylase biotin carboxylase subunit